MFVHTSEADEQEENGGCVRREVRRQRTWGWGMISNFNETKYEIERRKLE